MRVEEVVTRYQELSEMRQYSGAREELAPPERFLLELASVPRLRQRLQSFILLTEFAVRVMDIRSVGALALRCRVTHCRTLRSYSFHSRRFCTAKDSVKCLGCTHVSPAVIHTGRSS